MSSQGRARVGGQTHQSEVRERKEIIARTSMPARRLIILNDHAFKAHFDHETAKIGFRFVKFAQGVHDTAVIKPVSHEIWDLLHFREAFQNPVIGAARVAPEHSLVALSLHRDDHFCAFLP